jgi:hypothetical protein
LQFLFSSKKISSLGIYLDIPHHRHAVVVGYAPAAMVVYDSGFSENLSALSAIERTGSAVSLAGSLFVIATFCASPEFRKPINRLVFYASFGNLMTTIGTLMATAFTDDPLSPGCQIQGFLIQTYVLVC